MDAFARERFNAAFSLERYAAYASDLERRLGEAVDFRLAETPVFLPADVRARVLKAASEIVAQLAEPERIQRMRAAVPERWNAPNETALPNFAVVDFAIAREMDGRFVPRVVELQGFPSLLAFEVMQLDAWSVALDAMPGLQGDWTSFFGDRDRAAFLQLAASTIVGRHDPEHVALVDLEPERQKTRCDFAATKRLFGVDAVAATSLRKRGRRLFRTDLCGRELPVVRIYWRVIIDELERKEVTLPFDLRDELDVEWVPHPNWFWLWSKYSLPYLDHPAVPKTRLLSEIEALPENLERGYVLKPLFSFAGAGVNVAPSAADVAAIPVERRAEWCLQERIDYAAALPAADADPTPVKVEMRVMFVEGERPGTLEPVTNLCRLSRGAMHGVDYNKDRTWVGSSIAMWRIDPTKSGSSE